MRRWLLYLLLAVLAASFVAVAVQLSAAQIKLEWTKPLPEQGEFMVALDNETVLISDHNYDYVRAYDLDAKLLWEFRPPHPPGMIASINVDEDSCYVSTNSNWLYALDKHGNSKWQRQLVTKSDGWGYAVSVEGEAIRASLGAGEFYTFDSSGNLQDKGMGKEPPPYFTFQLNHKQKNNIYIGPGANSVIDNQGRLWMSVPLQRKRSLRYIEQAVALVVPRSYRYRGKSKLTVQDKSGRVLTRATLPFGHTSNAFALPDGRVVFIGGLGLMWCYSLAP